MEKGKLEAMSHQELVEFALTADTMCDIYRGKCNEMEKVLNGMEFQLGLLQLAIKNVIK